MSSNQTEAIADKIYTNLQAPFPYQKGWQIYSNLELQYIQKEIVKQVNLFVILRQGN